MGGERYRKPSRRPEPAEVADRDRWEELTKSTLVDARASAEKWRAGLAAFVTLVTGGLLLKGPEAASSVGWQWRLLLTLLLGGGLAAAVSGLWSGLRAAAGQPGQVGYDQVVERYGGVRQYEVASARAVVEALDEAKKAVLVSLILLGTAVFVWWWVPTAESMPPASVLVITTTGEVCGVLNSADQQELRIETAGSSAESIVEFEDVANLAVVDNCD